jgi:heme/copper-type cytochrome/quinol oxidase subunit 2
MGKFSAFKRNFDKKYIEIAKRFNEVRHDENAVMDNLSVTGIVGFAIALIVLAAVAPTALDTFYNTNTSGWEINGQEDSKVTALWWLIPLIVVAVVLMMIYEQIR